MKKVLALDQGTSSTRAVLYNHQGEVLAMSSAVNQIVYKSNGYVEQDPMQLLDAMERAARGALLKAGVSVKDILCMGISVQTGAFVLWEKDGGKPVCPVIGWQDGRGKEVPDRLESIFADHKTIYSEACIGKILFGTMETWLIWNLTGGIIHASDITNAEITTMYNRKAADWDREVLNRYHIPYEIFPEVFSNDGNFGIVSNGILEGIPITAVTGDSSAALFGERCWEKGDVKITYGTGVSVVLNMGEEAQDSRCAAAWEIQNRQILIKEATVYYAGVLLQKLVQDGIVKSVEETAELAVRATAGGGKRAEKVREVLESIGYQVAEKIISLEREYHIPVKHIRADGGVSRNEFLMQFQADILQRSLTVNENAEMSSYGAACMAAIAAGVWGKETMEKHSTILRTYSPVMSVRERDNCLAEWEEKKKNIVFL